MIFYLRNNRVIARFKRIDNAASARQLERPTGEKLWRDRENELREKGITKDERGGREGGRQKDEGRQKVNFETGWYRGKLYISELPAGARAPAGPSTVNDKYTRAIRKYCSKESVKIRKGNR